MGKVKSKGLPLSSPDSGNESCIYKRQLVEEAKDFEMMKNGVDVCYAVPLEKRLQGDEMHSCESDTGEMIEMIEYSSSHRLRAIQMLARSETDEGTCKFSPCAHDGIDLGSPICCMNSGQEFVQNQKSCKGPSGVSLFRNLYVSEMSISWQLLGSVNDSITNEENDFVIPRDRGRDHFPSVSFSEDGSVLIDPAELSSTEEIVYNLGEGGVRPRLDPVYSSDDLSVYDDSLNDSLPLSELCASGFRLAYPGHKRYLYDVSTTGSSESSPSPGYLSQNGQVHVQSHLPSKTRGVAHLRRSSLDLNFSMESDCCSACVDNENPSITTNDNSSSCLSSVLSSPDCGLPDGCGMSAPLGNAFSGFLSQYEALVQVQTENMELHLGSLPQDHHSAEDKPLVGIGPHSDDGIGKSRPSLHTNLEKQNSVNIVGCNDHNDFPEAERIEQRRSIKLSANDSVDEETMWSSIKTAKAKLKSMKKRLLSSAEADLFLNSPLARKVTDSVVVHQKHKKSVSPFQIPSSDPEDLDTLAKKLVADSIQKAILELSRVELLDGDDSYENGGKRMGQIENGVKTEGQEDNGEKTVCRTLKLSKCPCEESADAPCSTLDDLAHILATNAIGTALEDLSSFEPKPLELSERQESLVSLSDTSSKDTEHTFLDDSMITIADGEKESGLNSSRIKTQHEASQTSSMAPVLLVKDETHDDFHIFKSAPCAFPFSGTFELSDTPLEVQNNPPADNMKENDIRKVDCFFEELSPSPSEKCSYHGTITEAIPLQSKTHCINKCDSGEKHEKCDDVFETNKCDSDVVELCRSFSTLRIISDGTPPGSHDKMPPSVTEKHCRSIAPSSSSVSLSSPQNLLQQACQDRIHPQCSSKEPGPDQPNISREPDSEEPVDPTKHSDGQKVPPQGADLVCHEQPCSGDGFKESPDSASNMVSEELEKNARNQQLENLLHQIRDYRLRKNLPLRSHSTGTLPCTRKSSTSVTRAFSTNSQPTVCGDMKDTQLNKVAVPCGETQVITKDTKLTQTEFDLEEKAKLVAREKLGSYERLQWRNTANQEDLLKYHLQQFYNLMKVQPRRHTEEQLRHEKKSKLTGEKRQDLEELYRLRHQKRLEFLEKQFCSLSPDGSAKQSEHKLEQLQVLYQETTGREHKCLDQDGSLDDNVFADIESVHDQEIQPLLRDKKVSEAASNGTWAELEDEINQFVYSDPDTGSEIPFGSPLPCDSSKGPNTVSIYDSSWIPYSSKSSKSELNSEPTLDQKSGQIYPTGWSVEMGKIQPHPNENGDLAELHCVGQPSVRSNTAPFDDSDSPAAVYTRYGQPVHGWWANSPSLHVDYYGYIGRGGCRVTLPLAGGGMWQSVALRRAASEECDSSVDDVFVKESFSTPVNLQEPKESCAKLLNKQVPMERDVQLMDVQRVSESVFTHLRKPQEKHGTADFSVWDVCDAQEETKNWSIPFTRYQIVEQPKCQGSITENREQVYWENQEGFGEEANSGMSPVPVNKGTVGEPEPEKISHKNRIPAHCEKQLSYGNIDNQKTTKEEVSGACPPQSGNSENDPNPLPWRFPKGRNNEYEVSNAAEYCDRSSENGMKEPPDSAYVPRYGPMAVRARRISGEKTASSQNLGPLKKEEEVRNAGTRDAMVPKWEVGYSQNRYSGSRKNANKEAKPVNRTAFQKLQVSGTSEEKSVLIRESKDAYHACSTRPQFRRTPGNERKTGLGLRETNSSTSEKCPLVNIDNKQSDQVQQEKAPFHKTPGNWGKSEGLLRKANTTVDIKSYGKRHNRQEYQVFSGNAPLQKPSGKEMTSGMGRRQSACSMPSISELEEWTEEFQADEYFVLDTHKQTSLYLDIKDEAPLKYYKLHDSVNGEVAERCANFDFVDDNTVDGEIFPERKNQMLQPANSGEGLFEAPKTLKTGPKLMAVDECVSDGLKTSMEDKKDEVPKEKCIPTNHNWKHKRVYHNNSFNHSAKEGIDGKYTKPMESSTGNKYGPRRARQNGQESSAKESFDDYSLQKSVNAVAYSGNQNGNQQCHLKSIPGKSSFDNEGQASKDSKHKKRNGNVERKRYGFSRENNYREISKEDFQQPRKNEYRNRKRQTKGYVQGAPKSKKVAPNEEKQRTENATRLPTVAECEEEWKPSNGASRDKDVQRQTGSKIETNSCQKGHFEISHPDAGPTGNKNECPEKCSIKPKRKRRIGKVKPKEVLDEKTKNETQISSVGNTGSGRPDKSQNDEEKRRPQRSYRNSQLPEFRHVPHKARKFPMDTDVDPPPKCEGRPRTENDRNGERQRDSNSQSAPSKKKKVPTATLR